jgi:hypothetical protein
MLQSADAVVSTLTALTPPGWMSIASGAHSGMPVVSKILLPAPGAAPNEIRNGFDRSLSSAEHLWDAPPADGQAITLQGPAALSPADAAGSTTETFTVAALGAAGTATTAAPTQTPSRRIADGQ